MNKLEKYKKKKKQLLTLFIIFILIFTLSFIAFGILGIYEMKQFAQNQDLGVTMMLSDFPRSQANIIGSFLIKISFIVSIVVLVSVFIYNVKILILKRKLLIIKN